MKRLLLLLSLVALVFAIPVSDVLAGGHRVDVCHKGRIISVAPQAVEAHEAHGDAFVPDPGCVAGCEAALDACLAGCAGDAGCEAACVAALEADEIACITGCALVCL